MAFDNASIFNLTRFIVNKNGLSGYININDFNLLLRMASSVLLREKLGITNDYNLFTPVSKNQKGLSIISDDQIIQFKVKTNLSFTGGVASLPANYFTYDTVRVSGAYEPVEMLNSGELSKRIGNPIDAPDALFPAAEIIGSSMYIYPSTISSATLIYYRQTNTPSLSYYISADGDIVPMAAGVTHTLTTGEEGQNGEAAGITVNSSTVEHEWSSDCAIEMAYIILKNMGVNLNRADVFSAASQLKKEV